jgi:hypothetical protein
MMDLITYGGNDFMGISTARSLCLIVVALVGLFFVLDLLSAALAAIRKKPYKSALGNFIESFLEHPGIWWLAVLIAIMYAYGILSMRF